MSKVKKLDRTQALAHLFEYLDQELDGEIEEQVREHMHDCRSCFSRLEFEHSLKSHIRESGSESAPESLRNRVTGLIREFDRDS